MQPYEIKAALEKARITQVAIAKRLGVRQPTVSCVIRGKATSKRIAKAIAAAIGEPISKVWPGRYND